MIFMLIIYNQMENRNIIIIGNGETAKLAYLYFAKDTEYEVKAFAVDKQYIVEQELFGLPVVDFDEITTLYPPASFSVFVAVSSTKLNRIRMHLYNRCKGKGYSLVSYISSKAYVGEFTQIGDNCFILENNVVQHYVTIGNNVTLWSGNHIGHSSTIEDNVFVSSHVVISGFCKIGRNCFLGVNSAFADHVKIGEDCLIGMGTNIHKDVISDSIYVANYGIKHKLSSKQFYQIEE